MRLRIAFLSLSALAAWSPRCGVAQTIGDYSRAQRDLIEATMSQAGARSAALAASASTPVSAAAPSSREGVRPPRAVAAPAPAPMPSLSVSGVFASASLMVAEIAVDGSPYLLSRGQQVPGTPWRVEAIAVDRVVLARHDAPARGAAFPPASRVFALPSLR